MHSLQDNICAACSNFIRLSFLRRQESYTFFSPEGAQSVSDGRSPSLQVQPTHKPRSGAINAIISNPVLSPMEKNRMFQAVFSPLLSGEGLGVR